MFSSLIYTDLAADRQNNLIAAADAHRVARLARSRRETQPRTATPPRKARTFLRSILTSPHG